MIKQKIKTIAKTVIQFIINPRFLLCFGIAWLITNGWSYILLGIGTFCDIDWMVAVSGAYLTFLWLPISPEKIVTVLIAIGLLKLLFPNDQKTLGVLKELYGKYKPKVGMKKKQKNNKINKTQTKEKQNEKEENV